MCCVNSLRLSALKINQLSVPVTQTPLKIGFMAYINIKEQNADVAYLWLKEWEQIRKRDLSFSLRTKGTECSRCPCVT
jgi:hypothetical protein